MGKLKKKKRGGGKPRNAGGGGVGQSEIENVPESDVAINEVDAALQMVTVQKKKKVVKKKCVKKPAPRVVEKVPLKLSEVLGDPDGDNVCAVCGGGPCSWADRHTGYISRERYENGEKYPEEAVESGSVAGTTTRDGKKARYGRGLGGKKVSVSDLTN